MCSACVVCCRVSFFVLSCWRAGWPTCSMCYFHLKAAAQRPKQQRSHIRTVTMKAANSQLLTRTGTTPTEYMGSLMAAFHSCFRSLEA